MNLLKNTFVCPFCFEERPLEKLEYRCDNLRCEDVDDLPMTRYEHGNLETPKQGKHCFPVKMKGRTVIDEGECDMCHKKTHRIVCPECHNTLPESTIKGTDMIISIVGARDTGKSHFVAVIINELRNRIAPDFGGSITGFDDTQQRYNAGFYQKLYVDLQKLEQTHTSLQDVNNGAYRPLIYTLKLKRKVLFKEVIDSYTLVFFDTAGEDLDDSTNMNTVNRYISKSSGIIFLLDPLKIQTVVHELDENTVKGASTVGWQQVTQADDIMGRVADMIRQDRHMKSNAMIDVPVAAVFSKFDAITSQVPQDYRVIQPSPHCSNKVFMESDRKTVDNEIKSLLTAWNDVTFLSQMETNYSNFSFFAASALGLENNPQGDSIKRPRPHRIEDAILWILSELKVIKKEK